MLLSAILPVFYSENVKYLNLYRDYCAFSKESSATWVRLSKNIDNNLLDNSLLF